MVYVVVCRFHSRVSTDLAVSIGRGKSARGQRRSFFTGPSVILNNTLLSLSCQRLADSCSEFLQAAGSILFQRACDTYYTSTNCNELNELLVILTVVCSRERRPLTVYLAVGIGLGDYGRPGHYM